MQKAKSILFLFLFFCFVFLCQEMTGYLVGGTSPFGLKTALPVFLQETILKPTPVPAGSPPLLLHSGKIYLNGGQRGYLVSLDVSELVRVLQPKIVDVAEKESGTDTSTKEEKKAK